MSCSGFTGSTSTNLGVANFAQHCSIEGALLIARSFLIRARYVKGRDKRVAKMRAYTLLNRACELDQDQERGRS